MIYALFLCTAYLGRPDLNTCDMQSLYPFQSARACQTELGRMLPLEGDGMTGDVRWHRYLVCKSHAAEWQDVPQ